MEHNKENVWYWFDKCIAQFWKEYTENCDSSSGEDKLPDPYLPLYSKRPVNEEKDSRF